jgi:SAM-dependent methyltransferase
MGEQIHVGGFASSMDLAREAGISQGMQGVDFCCCTGAGMRFLVKFCGVKRMHGVDATSKVIERGKQRCKALGLDGAISFTLGDVRASGLPSGSADFVWGEDAWCYVVDKPKLISEAARVVKKGGVIAFTDWLEGPTPLSGQEAERFLGFMKFPSIMTLEDYRDCLKASGCSVQVARDTGRFAGAVQLYIQMLEQQLTFDALRIIDFNTELSAWLMEEMRFAHLLAQEGKLIQGLIVARKG